MDQYPYTASGGGVQTGRLPTWALEGGRESLRKRLQDVALRARIKAEVARIIRLGGGQDYLAKIVISHCQWDESLAGKTFADVARLRGKSASPEDGAEAALWIEQGDCEKGPAQPDERTGLARILRRPAVASDGEIPAGLGDQSRLLDPSAGYGTFARARGLCAGRLSRWRGGARCPRFHATPRARDRGSSGPA
jgi:hypothetical protein